MPYQNNWGSSTPGHLIFLIDQSGSMEGEKAKKAAQAIQASILETALGCQKGDDISPRAYITVIGYGKDDSANIIREGWIGDWASDVIDADDTDSVIIPAEAFNTTPMDVAFKLAKSCLDAWIQKREEDHQANPQLSLAAPLVINITDGAPTDKSGYETDPAYENARKAAEEIMNTSTRDGNVLLFNIHISNDGGAKILFPADKTILNGNKYGEFLFDISSQLIDSQISVGRTRGFEMLRPGSKGFAVNVKSGELIQLLLFMSPV